MKTWVLDLKKVWVEFEVDLADWGIGFQIAKPLYLYLRVQVACFTVIIQEQWK